MAESIIVSPVQFDFGWLNDLPAQKKKRGNSGSRQTRTYKDIITAFDIETSPIPGTEQAAMYIWQWQFGLEYTVMGRTWDEWRGFVGALLRYIPEDQSLVILVHNLSYEFQFLRTVYDFKPAEVFAVKSRKVLKCTMYDKRLEYRCTYFHSNMSLDQYTQKMGVEHQKLDSDEFDHSKVRYPWTPLTDRELQYCQNDVLGLVEAYQAEMYRDHDNLQTIPLTSTGYVRRDAKRAMRMAGRKMVRDSQPDLETYRMLREAFRGGNTHANRYFSGKILRNVSSADRSSSYPDVLCNCKFPMGRFRELEAPTLQMIERLIRQRRAVLFRFAVWGITMLDPFDGFPYLSGAKCREVIGACYDNGRILSAEYLETTVTDVDFGIIRDQYQWDDIQILDALYTWYGYLPRPLVLTTIEYYTTKTGLKDVEGQEQFYEKSKNLLNSLYGMMAQDPVKQTIDFLAEDPQQFVERRDDIGELLEKHSKRAFLCYQWGVWITAWARLRLQEGLNLAGHNAVYCDTDSVKYIGIVDWCAYNAKRKKDSKASGAHATDPHGTEHYMGVFEAENPYSRFVTLGAKKYAYDYGDGKTHATISGVSKKWGGPELDAAGGLEAFKEEFTFSKAGGTESIYNDHPPTDHMMIDGHRLEIGPNIYIKPSTYTLGITAEYERILANPMLFLEMKHRLTD